MTEIARVFEYDGDKIRTVLIDGEPWFVASDVCSVLGLTNVTEALRGLDDDEFRTTEVVDSAGRRQRGYVVSEAGLYSLILRSRKPEAKAFKRWLTHEALPTLRKTGRYEVAPLDELEVARRYVQALESKKQLEVENADQRARLAVAEPKAEYVDGFVNPGDDASLIKVFAAQIGVREGALRDWLVARRLIFRRVAGQRWSSSKRQFEPVYEWLARAEIREKKWFLSVDQPAAPRLHNGQIPTTLYVTPLGKTHIRRLLMKHPIEPAA